jgi:hypothetical protein
VSEQLGLFAGRMRERLLAASVAIGLEVMGELVEAEVAEIAGAKGKHDPGRRANRHRGPEREGSRRRESNDEAFLFGEFSSPRARRS